MNSSSLFLANRKLCIRGIPDRLPAKRSAGRSQKVVSSLGSAKTSKTPPSPKADGSKPTSSARTSKTPQPQKEKRSQPLISSKRIFVQTVTTTMQTNTSKEGPNVQEPSRVIIDTRSLLAPQPLTRAEMQLAAQKRTQSETGRVAPTMQKTTQGIILKGTIEWKTLKDVKPSEKSPTSTRKMLVKIPTEPPITESPAPETVRPSYPLYFQESQSKLRIIAADIQTLVRDRVDLARSSHYGTTKINAEMNWMYVQRLEDIDSKIGGDVDLKVTTLLEWVDLLLHINEAIISNIQDLEGEVANRLENVQRKGDTICRHIQSSTELAKCRRDIGSLIKVIQNAYYHNDWNMNETMFETITPEEVLGFNEKECFRTDTPLIAIQNEPDLDISIQDKLFSNIRALAFEVAEKHDEIRELKRQIFVQDDEIQKAQMKIQLKDDVIRELRCDLKTANAKLSEQRYYCNYLEMPVSCIESKNEAGDVANSKPLTNDESPNEVQPNTNNNNVVNNEKLKALENDLKAFFVMPSAEKQTNLEGQRQQLASFFKTVLDEKEDIARRLEFLRDQLVDIERVSSVPTKFSSNEAEELKTDVASDAEADTRIVDALRNRLQRAKDVSIEMHRNVHKMEMKNNELNVSMESLKIVSDRNAKILKELAEQFVEITGNNFKYDQIYEDNNCENPFLVAVQELHDECEKLLAEKAVLTEHEQELLDSEDVLQNNYEKKIAFVKNQAEKKITEVEDKRNELALKNDKYLREIEHLKDIVSDRDECILQLQHKAAQLSHTRNADYSDKNTCVQEYPTCSHAVSQMEKCSRTTCEWFRKLQKASNRVIALESELERKRDEEQALHEKNRRLSKELSDSKFNNTSLINQVTQLTKLVDTYKKSQLELTSANKALEESYEEHDKKLRASKVQLKNLQEGLDDRDQRTIKHEVENKLLRKEILALKEREAVLIGREKSMQARCLQLDAQLHCTQDVVRDQQSAIKHKELSHKESLLHTQETVNELKQKLVDLENSNKQLEEDYRKQRDVLLQTENLLLSFRKWKDEQVKADEVTKLALDQYEAHIKLLLEEKQKEMDQYRELHRDHSILQHELDRLKVQVLSQKFTGPNSLGSGVAHRLDRLHRTTIRISQLRHILSSEQSESHKFKKKKHQSL